MGLNDNLKIIISRQKEILAELETESKILEDINLIKENEELKTELEKTKGDYFSVKEKLWMATEKIKELKNALQEQIHSERNDILRMSARKMEVYFKSNYEGELNRLLTLENSIKERINHMTNQLISANVDINDNIYKELDNLSLLLYEKVTLARYEANTDTGILTQNEKSQYEQIKNEQITDEMINESANKINYERFIGLNLINKLGILLIIIGVIVASQYTYTQFDLPDYLKGILMFALGAVMLVSGELLNRKKANVFSLGITAGGVAVLYVALAISYFWLNILDMYPAITLCVLITSVAFILAIRYNAQVVLAFALIGGYLPMFSIHNNSAMIYGAMVYFVVLNLLDLIISFKKKWIVSAYIGLILNILGSAYICIRVFGSTRIVTQVITILYILLAFLIYTLIPIISTWKMNLRFKTVDITLVAINTFFSSLILYFMFYGFRLTDLNGLLAIILAVVYILLGKFTTNKFVNDKTIRTVFYLTSFAFIILVVPLQFDKAWLSLGWLAEGFSLICYGILRNDKNFRKIGFIMGGLCLASFLYFDLLFQDSFFAYKYFAITFSSLVILGLFVYKKMLSSKFEIIYKNLTVLNLWFYSLYLINNQLVRLVDFNYLSAIFICNTLAIAVSFFIAYLVPKVRILSDSGIKKISITIYIISIAWSYRLTAYSTPFEDIKYQPFGDAIIGTVIIILLSLLTVFAITNLLKDLVLKNKLRVEWLPLIVSSYLVSNLTSILINQYKLEFSNAIISIAYVVAALAMVIFGVARRYAYIRRVGLIFAILSVAKLFLIDISRLTSEYQIVSYFSLGVSLITISYVYQYFNKLLDLKGEVVDDDAEKDS